MAMADTEKMSNQQREFRRQESDFTPTSSTMASRPTRQLDFNQAMSDFKVMFPNMDEEVIEAVLRANNGIVDATIDQLLTMNVDSDDVPDHLLWEASPPQPGQVEPAKMSPLPPESSEQDSLRQPIEESPPPYSEAIQSPQMLMTTNTRRTSMKSSPPEPPTANLLDLAIDDLSLSNTEPKTPISPWNSPISSSGRPKHMRSFSANSSVRKSTYRDWNPPMLGDLPRDFLRLSLDSPQVASLSSASQRTQHRRTSSQSRVISSHDFSSDMLQEKIKENERRRKMAASDLDPELAQYLEDERLALMFQNSEFLQELRDNEDFMNTLERDRMNAAAFEPKPAVTPDEGDFHEGYGQDRQETLEAFPFSQQLPKGADEDAELQRKLSHMGKASRKQFAALARRFFSRRKKKSSKQILKEKLAPSKMNLLDEEEMDNGAENGSEHPYGMKPETESAPGAVPSYRTVQRPPYHPETVITYNNENSHMV